MQKMSKKANSTEPKATTALRLDPELLKKIDEVAKLQSCSRTSVIEQCLESGLPRLKKFFEEFHS